MLKPESHGAEDTRVDAFIASGQLEQARLESESSPTPMDEDDRHFNLALIYQLLKRPADAEKELAKLQALDGDRGAYLYAAAYSQWGDTAAGINWLKKAELLRDPLLWILKVDWRLDPIRDQPEFKAIEARMNFPP